MSSKQQFAAFMQKSMRIKLVCEIIPPIIFLGLAITYAQLVDPQEWKAVPNFYPNTNVHRMPWCLQHKGTQTLDDPQPIYVHAMPTAQVSNADLASFVVLLNNATRKEESHSPCSFDAFEVSATDAGTRFEERQTGFLAGVDITEFDLGAKKLAYNLRMVHGRDGDDDSETEVPSTRKTRGQAQRSARLIEWATIVDPNSWWNPCKASRPWFGCSMPYLEAGFVDVQALVNVAFHEFLGSHLWRNVSLEFTELPRPEEITRPINSSIVAQYLCLSYIAAAFVLVKQMLSEKEKRIKEGMSIMSMKASVFWSGWFCTALVSFLPVSLIVLIAGAGITFKNSPGGFTFLLVFFFMMSLISMTFLFYTVFQKANTGGLVVLITQTVGAFAYPALNLTAGTNKFLGILLSPLAFLRGAELLGSGIDDFNQSDYSFGSVVGILLWDAVWYLAAAWYIDKIYPGEFGQRLPFYFCFLPSYWSGKHEAQQTPAGTVDAELKTDIGRIQALPEEFQSAVSVVVEGLHKRFQLNPFKISDDDKIAVNGLRFQMVEGQVFSLLGHNGAGKTTTIQMLCGMLPKSSGTITIKGRNVETDLQEIRQSLGFCPQHDVLYDELSVEEHLELYGKIKGIQGPALAQEITDLIQSVDLVEKRFNRVNELSGGMKRKLSLAIAYIGNPSLVVLDEPTSGMDPLSRRKMWELIMAKKPGRTTLLTTHFLDEADILGDRIGIMASGNMRCLGTSLFLKNRFGLGYNLGIVKVQGADSQQIQGVVQQTIPAAERQTDTPLETSYRLPVTATGMFPTLLRSLAQHGPAIGVQSFGVSITTLEEVFLKIADESDDFKAEDGTSATEQAAGGLADQALSADWEGSPNFAAQAKAIALKRVWQTKRRMFVLLLNLGIPFLLLLAGGALSKSISSSRAQSPLLLTPDEVWTKGQTLYYSAFDAAGYDVSIVPGAATIIDPVDINFSGLANEFSRIQQIGDDEILKYPGAYSIANLSTVSSAYGGNRQRAWVPDDMKAPQENGLRFWLNSTVTNTMTKIVVWANRRIVHGIPVLVDKLPTVFGSDIKVETTTEPLEWKTETASIDVTIFIMFLALAYSCPVGFVGVPICAERTNKSYHLMKLMGLNPTTYWVTIYVFDICYMFIPTFFAMIFIKAFDVTPISGESFPVAVLILILYQFAAVPFAYVLTRIVSDPANYQLSSVMIQFVFGVIGFIAYFVLELIGGFDDGAKDAATGLLHSFSFIPLFACAAGLNRMATVPNIDENWDDPSSSRVLESDTKVANIFIYAFIVWFLDHLPNLLSRKVPAMDAAERHHDPDVETEKQRLIASPSPDMITMKGLRKVYPKRGKVAPKMALDELYLGVPQGEVFGLLGGNGAGKTTCMKILTGDHSATTGEAIVNGGNIATNIRSAYQVMGYCPQFDALWPDLTGREHLRIFSMLKGVPTQRATDMSNAMLERMALGPYAERLAGTYSGGNKRKLSVTIALMANPKVVYLDEPSTGMDPASRRFMWSVIQSSMASRAVILTTHSMEEADALCHRIGIMVNGELRCLGTSQHLKNKFGAGLQIHVHTVSGNEANVEQFIRSFLPQAVVVEAFAGQMAVEVENSPMPIADVFERFELGKQACQILEYSVSQTTLEKVFLRFARGQISDE